MKSVPTFTNQLKTLIPNFAAYGAAYGIEYVVNKLNLVDIKEVKKFIRRATDLLDTFPTTQDTVFSSFKKALKFGETAGFKKYETMAEFEEEFEMERKGYYPFEDEVFKNIVPNINIALKPIKKELGFLSDSNLLIEQLYYPNGIDIIFVVEHYCFESQIRDRFYANSVDYRKIFLDFLKDKGNHIAIKSSVLHADRIEFEQIKHWSLKNETFVSPLVTEISTDLQRYVSKNVQRSYLLVGDPGVGKTCCVYQIAKDLGDKCVKIDNRVVNDYSAESLEGLLRYSGIKTIIFDDIDRNEKDVPIDKMLYYVESFKEFETKPVFLATANSIEDMDAALLRPGRFDRILKVTPYEEGVRKEFVQFLLPTCVEKDLNQLVSITDNFSNASITEVCNQYKVGIPIEVIDADMKRRLELMEESNQDDENYKHKAKRKRTR